MTFSKDMYDSTVEASDFGNAGTAPVSIGTVTGISPGVLTVQATPTAPGTLQLQVNPGSVLNDTEGIALDTSAAIIDDTVITVFAAPAGGTPTLSHVSNIHISNGTDFNISVYPGKAGYAGTGSTFGRFSADLIDWTTSGATPTVLTGTGENNPADVEAASVPYPFFIPITGGGFKKPTFFRVAVSMP